MACETLQELEKKLDEANKAYHALMTGTAIVEVEDQNGERVRFNQTSRGVLYTYIQQLKTEIGYFCPMEVPTVKGPMGFFF